jgi:hypothetical protein
MDAGGAARMKVADMTKRQLDCWSAFAMGASAKKTPPENQLVTGLPFKYYPGQEPMFRVVNAAGISLVWGPTINWVDCGRILSLLMASGDVMLSNLAGELVRCEYINEDQVTLQSAQDQDVRVALVRVYVQVAFGKQVGEQIASMA